MLAALGRSAKAGFSREIAAHHSFKRLMSPELATPPLTGGARQGNRTYSGFAEASKRYKDLNINPLLGGDLKYNLV